jgi:PAS domain S-box-containing protein
MILGLFWRLKMPLFLSALAVFVICESNDDLNNSFSLYGRLAGIGLVAAVWAFTRNRHAIEHRLFDVIQDVCCIASFDGTLLSINPAAEKLFGYTRTELIGTPFLLLVHPEDRQETLRQIEQMVMGFVTPEVEIRTRAKDGSYKWIRWTGAIGRGDAFFIATGRDATANRETDYKLARLSIVLDHTDDAIYSKALDDRIGTWNRAAEALFGYSGDEIIGREASLLVPADRAGEETLLLAKLRIGLYVGQTKTVRRRKDGSLVSVLLNMSLIRDRQHNVCGVSLIVRPASQSESPSTSGSPAEALAAR